MFSKFFINRPIFASVLSIVIVLAGTIALFTLPVAQYPEILPPQVSVTASYPGASSQVIAETVAAPLEQEINGVEGMIYQLSNSDSSGAMSLTVYFKVGTDPDQATRIQQVALLVSKWKEEVAEPEIQAKLSGSGTAFTATVQKSLTGDESAPPVAQMKG